MKNKILITLFFGITSSFHAFAQSEKGIASIYQSHYARSAIVCKGTNGEVRSTHYIPFYQLPEVLVSSDTPKDEVIELYLHTIADSNESQLKALIAATENIKVIPLQSGNNIYFPEANESTGPLISRNSCEPRTIAFPILLDQRAAGNLLMKLQGFHIDRELFDQLSNRDKAMLVTDVVLASLDTKNLSALVQLGQINAEISHQVPLEELADDNMRANQGARAKELLAQKAAFQEQLENDQPKYSQTRLVRLYLSGRWNIPLDGSQGPLFQYERPIDLSNWLN